MHPGPCGGSGEMNELSVPSKLGGLTHRSLMAWFLTVKQQTVHDCVNYMIGIQRQENLQVDWVLEGLRGNTTNGQSDPDAQEQGFLM